MTNLRPCSVDGCDKSVCNSRGWCSAHYARFRKHGDPLGGGTSKGSAPAFLENTAFSFDGEECLIWPFSKDNHGYGQISIGGTKRRVHRVICEAEHGPPPTPKHEATHSCGNGHEGCCNRKHLRWATHAENMADTLVHGTSNRGERHGAAKLAKYHVLEIRAARGTQAAIASRFGVSQATVSKIRSGARWGHL